MGRINAFGWLSAKAWVSLALVACLDVSKTMADPYADAYAQGLGRVVPEQYFGMHIHRADTGTVWPAVKFGSWRLWDAYVGWPDLELERGKWDFRRLDKYVAMAKLTGVEILLPLGRTPQWASNRPNERAPYGPGQAAEPRDVQDWRDYVRAVALRYKGRIRYFEIWNEPNESEFFSGTPDKLLELQREAYRILKEVDPSNIVVMPAAVHATKWLDDYLALGGGQYADVIGYHFYVPKEAPEAIFREVSIVRSLMRKHGVGDKLLWNTETGWWIANTDGTPEEAGVSLDWKRLAPDEAAAYVARALIVGRWAGLDRFYWYAWDNQGLGLIEPGTGQLKPAARAYRQVHDWLAGQTIQRCAVSGPVWSCTIGDRPGAREWLVWTTAGSGEWRVPSGWFVASLDDLDGHSASPSDRFRVPVRAAPVRVNARPEQ